MNSSLPHTRKDLLLGLLTCAFYLVHGPAFSAEPSETKPGRAALTVSVDTPQTASWPTLLTANGNVAAWQEASIGSESNGLKLSEVLVQVGDSVRAGQVLARFATDTVQADLAQAQAALLEAKASAAEAKGNADRARALQPTGVLSIQQTQQILTAEQTAAARVESALAVVAVQQLRLKHTQVVAPDSGVISSRSATVGAVTSAGTELFRLIRQGRLEWQAEVTAAELPALRPGMAVNVTPVGGPTVSGRVRSIAPTINAQTRNGLVYVDLINTRAQGATPVRAGSFARGNFEVGQSAALTLPQSAVVMRDGFAWVFVLDPQQRVRQTKVVTGRRKADLVEILQGLTPTTPVVVQGAGFLQDADLVKVVAPAASR
jgi:RND family efflux transporter MFP subunit